MCQPLMSLSPSIYSLVGWQWSNDPNERKARNDSMFRFEAIKPEIQEVIQEKEVTKDALRHIFFYSLLELERLRNHLLNLESDIDHEGDLYLLMNLGDRRGYTSESIERREELTRRVFPMIMKRILEDYMQRKEIDRWDHLILYNERDIEDYLSGKISYQQLIERTIPG